MVCVFISLDLYGTSNWPLIHLILLFVPGVKDKCVDSLVFETLIPKPMMQHYISLLLKHRRLVLSGPSGTGKTYLTTRLTEYLLEKSGRDPGPGLITTFNMHQQTCKVKPGNHTFRQTELLPHWFVLQAVVKPHFGLLSLRTSSCTCLIWPIRLTVIVALRTFHWSLSWMISVMGPPSPIWSIVHWLANITNGEFQNHEQKSWFQGK